MDKKLKVVLAAKVDGAQFVCTVCKKVFISEKHLKLHEERKHSSPEILPTQRIKHLVDFLNPSKIEIGGPKDVKVHGSGWRTYPKMTIAGLNKESPRSRLSRLMNVNPLLLGGIEHKRVDSVKVSGELTKKPEFVQPVECYEGVNNENYVAKREFGVKKVDSISVNTAITSELRTNIEFREGDLDSAVWKFAELTKEDSLGNPNQSYDDNQSRKLFPEHPYRSKLLGHDNSNNIFSMEETSDSWLFRDDSGSEETSSASSSYGGDFAQRSGADLVGDSVEDLKMPSWEEIEEEVLNENSDRAEVMMDLEARLMEFGIDPKAKGIPNNVLEKSRLALHAKRAMMMKDNETFKNVLDDLRIVLDDKAKRKCLDELSTV